MVTFFSVIFLVFVIVVFFYSVFTLIGLIRAHGVPYVPLDKKQLAKINENILLDKSDYVVDLGCGDGRVLRLFEKQGVEKLDGYEVNLSVCCQAWVKNLIKKSKVKIYHKNFNKVDLSKYNKVFCYLLPQYLGRIRKKLQRELQGSTIISYAFEVPGWQADKIIYTNKENKNLGRIFIYKIK